MTLEDFISGLKELGSEGSKLTNAYVLHGVKGLSFTQQLAMGAAYRKGVKPEELDMEESKFNIYGRLALSGIEIEGGLKIKSKKAKESGVTSIFAQYQFKELYLDWQAGFDAAEYYCLMA